MFPINVGNILAVQEEEAREELRRFNFERRIMRTKSNPFQLNETHFKELFRLTKNMAHYVLNRIMPVISQKSSVLAIKPDLSFFAALYFYATGSYQRTVGQSYNLSMSQQSVSRAVIEVTNAIVNELGQEWIKFPTTIEEKNLLKARFMEVTRFPGAIGSIDCTHVAIIAPSIEEHNYFNRKGFHSKNIQIICDYDLRILNVNARYAGATHDAYVWRNSSIRDELERCWNNGDQNTWLLGDAGYPQEPWLMTPILNPPPNSPEARYNDAHSRARNCVERCNGVLKSRFRCIMGERKLRYTPAKVGQIISACIILHNICVEGHLEVDHYEAPIEDNILIQPLHNNEGNIVRTNLIRRYFI